MDKFDPDWLDRMYNNRALVPEHGALFAQWAQASTQARATQACTLDLPYGEGPMETLDVFPAAKPGAPVVVFIHGGYWRSLDKADHAFLAPAFTRHGACTFIPNYALCPAVTIPQIVLQMVKALDWVHRNARRYGGDPSRIYVVGHSAGGHLAAMMLQTLWGQWRKGLPEGLVRAAMSISGLYDLEPVMHTPFLKESLRLTPKQVALASPGYLPAPRHGLLYTVAGAQESPEFIRHNGLIQELWGPRSVPVCELLAGRNHFTVLDDLVTPGARLDVLVRELLRH